MQDAIIFQAGFLCKHKSMNRKEWLCYTRNKNTLQTKRSLYAFTNNSTNPKSQAHYAKYYKILIKVIKRAKKQYYSRLIENLTFICPCIANIFAEYNQQRPKFHNVFISVRRSTCFRRFFRSSSGAQNCTYSVRYLSDRYCYLLLAARLTAVSSIGLTNTWRCYVQFWAPDDERKNRLKHVERLRETNKLWNFGPCWLYSANILAMHGRINVKPKVRVLCKLLWRYI